MEESREIQYWGAGGGAGHAVQWLRPCTSTAGDTSSICDQGTKILHATGLSKKKKKVVFKMRDPRACL